MQTAKNPTEQSQDSKTLLKILGLPNGTSWEKVQETYIELMSVWNPERFDHDPQLKTRVRKKTSEIKIAYARLEEMRCAYERLQQLTTGQAECEVAAAAINTPVQIPVVLSESEAQKVVPVTELIPSSTEEDIRPSRRAKLARKLRWLKPVLFPFALPFYAVAYTIRGLSLLLDFLYSTTLFQASLRVALAAIVVFVLLPKAKHFSIQDQLLMGAPAAFKERYAAFSEMVLNEKVSNVPPPSYYARFESSGSVWKRLGGIFGGSDSENQSAFLRSSYEQEEKQPYVHSSM
jgi:hypothetical protein